MIYGQITGQAQLIARFADLPAKVKREADATVRRLGFELQRDVQKNYLTGQSLHVRTGRLRSSIAQGGVDTRSRLEITPTSAYAYVGTNVEYAGVHEYGFDGMVAVKPHVRHSYKYRVGKKTGERKRTNKVTGYAYVNGFMRHMRMPKRAYLAPAFAAIKPKVLDAFNAMLAGVVRAGLKR